MAWPTTLTDNDDVKRHAFVQEISRLLEAGNTYTELHEGVAIEVRNWLEGPGGVSDADLISNSTDFAPAAVQLFLSKLHRGRGELEEAFEYEREFARQMKRISPVLSESEASGGIVGKVVLLKQGSNTFYTRRRNNQVFQRGRNE